MIYATKTGTDNHEWFLNSAGSNLEGEDVNRGSDSEGTYYTISSSQVRGHALTRHGYHAGDMNSDHGEIDLNNGGSGHMQEQGGWRDVEMTGYFYGTTSSGDTEFVPYCRGGRHNGDQCEGFAYKGVADYSNGQVRIRKEQWHPSGYVNQDWRPGFGGSTRNKWVGMKFIVVNRGAQPNIAVYMEIWVDKNNDNNWERVYTYTDKGGWGSGGGRCGGDGDQIGTWSGPYATFRWDIGGMRFKKLSVREIKEGSSFEPPPPGSGGPPPPPGGEDPWMRIDYPNEGISASGFDEGNIPANVNDGDMATVWFQRSLPAWIKMDLGGVHGVAYLKIAWFRGAERTIGFTIHLSEDNTNFTEVFNGSSSGVTNDFERYDFTDINARFVMVNVTSNSGRVAASVGEIQIWGSLIPIGQEPPGTPPPIPQDPLYVYVPKKHVFHVNYDDGPQCP